MVKIKLQLFAISTKNNTKKVVNNTTKNVTAKNNTTVKNKNTNTNNTPTINIAGVDPSLVGAMTSTYIPSGDVKQAEANKNNSANAYKNWASNKNIIDQNTWDAINKQWETPSSVLEADAFLKNQLDQIRSGRTSYTDQVESIFNKFMNREDFQYDVSEDQLFQQALASAMGSGKTAMQDTIGQASALTGGYGSTYATSAGNQAYNSFIEDAYNNLPEYYNMALKAYQMEAEEMLQQFNMASTLDNQEYGRLLDSYNAGVDDRNWKYNTAFNEYTTSVNNAYNSANLQLQQNAQIGNNLYNTYAIDKDTYETKYNQGYQSWLDSVNNASVIAGMQNKHYWSQTEFDYQKERDAEEDRKWQESFDYQKDRDIVEDYKWQESFDYQKDRDIVEDNKWQESFDYQKERDAVNDSHWEKQFGLDQQQVANSNYKSLYEESQIENENLKNQQKIQASKSSKTDEFEASVLTPEEFSRRGNSITVDGKQNRYDNYNQYISDMLNKKLNSKELTENEVAYLVWKYGITE